MLQASAALGRGVWLRGAHTPCSLRDATGRARTIPRIPKQMAMPPRIPAAGNPQTWKTPLAAADPTIIPPYMAVLLNARLVPRQFMGTSAASAFKSGM